VLVAPDSFGGTLTARQAADAIVEGWQASRPSDEVASLPLSDGGEGLLEVVAGPQDRWIDAEVADPLGKPLDASLLLRPDGTAIIESARACGLTVVSDGRRDPRATTSFGVGQLLTVARANGAA